MGSKQQAAGNRHQPTCSRQREIGMVFFRLDFEEMYSAISKRRASLAHHTSPKRRQWLFRRFWLEFNTPVPGHRHSVLIQLKNGSARVGISLFSVRMAHPPHSSSPKHVGEGPWTSEEDARLKQAVGRHNGKRWKAVASEVQTRSHIQCLQRWSKALKPDLGKGRWVVLEVRGCHFVLKRVPLSFSFSPSLLRSIRHKT
jgi:hypothetical protein